MRYFMLVGGTVICIVIEQKSIRFKKTAFITNYNNQNIYDSLNLQIEPLTLVFIYTYWIMDIYYN
jgi:hypothetical protein